MQTTAHDQGALTSPQAPRLHRPGWRDPRLLLGVVLVAASVALGSWLVGAAGRTTPVFVADGPLVAGELVEPGSLLIRQVRLPDGPDLYLTADDALPAGLVATRTVGSGEIVPLSAVAAARDLDVRPVAIGADGGLSSGVVEGSVVDLWFVPDPRAGAGGLTPVAAADGAVATAPDASMAPQQLAAGLTVAEVVTPDGAFAVGASTTVQVLVPIGDLGEVLRALALEGSVEVVSVPGSAARP